MDISSDSSDTIILPLNNEPSDTEVENILKKYSSSSSSVECKGGTKSRNDLYDLNHFSDEDVNDIPLIKRVRNSSSVKSMKQNVYNHDKGKYVLDNPPDNNEDIRIWEFESGISGKLDRSDEIFKELHKKYFTSPINEKKDLEDNIIELSDSSDSNDSGSSLNLNNFLPEASKVAKMDTGKHKGNVPFKLCSDDEVNEELDLSPKAAAKARRRKEIDKRRQDRAKEKERRREEAEKKKAMKNTEKEKKKEVVEQQKAMKNALKSVQRSTRSDECIKHIIVEIDHEIAQTEYGEVLKTTLKDKSISFKSKSQVFPKLISWRRNLQTVENMLLKNTEVSEKHFLLLMDLLQFSDLVRNNSFTLYVQNVSKLTQSKHLTLAVFGADKPKGNQDLAITEAQLFSKCYFRFVKKSEDFAALVIEVTKAVAQIPYKLKNEEKNMLHSEYFNDSNKDTVRVDKNGNGLGRLWHQMLTMFPLARLETAEAITAAYPTPFSLFKAYDGCEPRKEQLLQNLPIRRAFGPCATVRRIGPELSRKCSNFFCATENILL